MSLSMATPRYSVKRVLKKRPIEERFWSKVDRSGGPTSCWLWLGFIGPDGRGQFPRPGQSGKAHRAAYELVNGPIPEGLTIDHLCYVPRCVNPAHLEPVTFAENRRRATIHRTTCRNGHPYDAVVRTEGKVWRRCSTCAAANDRAYKARRAAA